MTINLWGRETQNPLVINADTGVQRSPVVASVGLDAFAVAWIDGNRVSLKFFDEQGNVDAASPQVTVTDATSANLSELQMVGGGAGVGYGIAWSENNSGVSQLKLRYYNHVAASTLGGEISISSNPLVDQHDLEISNYNKDDARGRSIVDGFDAVWVEGAGGAHALGTVYLQRFAVPLDARKDPTSPPVAAGLDGVAGTGGDAQVSITASGRDPSVAGLNVGLGGGDETIVTWIDATGNINIRAYNNAGTQLNTITGVTTTDINTAARALAAGTQQHVTALQGGGFLVAWISDNAGNHDLVGRVFTPGAAGGAWTSGPIFVIDPLNGASNNITDFTIAAQETDGFSASWTATDAGTSAIFSRVYTGGGIANDAGTPAIFHGPASVNNISAAAIFGDRYVVVYEDNAVDAGDIGAKILDPRFDANGLPITVNGPGITMTGDPLFETRGRIAPDILVGTIGRDTINGRQGDDIMDGGLGNDTILAGLGNDTIDGGGGDDTLVLSGRFTIDGNAANDDYTLSYLGGGLFQITDKRGGTVGEGVDFARSIENFQFLGSATNFTLAEILGIETTNITPTAWGWTDEDANTAPNLHGEVDVDGFIVNPGVSAGVQKNVSVSDSVGEFIAVAWEESSGASPDTHIKGRFYNVVLAPDEFIPNTMNLSDGIGIETNVAIASGGANSGWGFVFEQRDNAADTTRELRTNFMGPGQLTGPEISVLVEANVDQHDAAIFGSMLDRTLQSPVGGSVLPTGMNEGYNVAWVSTHTDGVDGALDAGYGRIMLQRFEAALDPLGNPGAPKAGGIDGIVGLDNVYGTGDNAVWVGNEDAVGSDGFFGRNPSTSALHTFETGIVWIAKNGAGEKVMLRMYDDVGKLIDYPAGDNISGVYGVAAGTSAHIVSAGAVNFAIVWITPDATSPSGYTVMGTMLSSPGTGLNGEGFTMGAPPEPFVLTKLPVGFNPANSDFAATGISGEDSNDVIVSWTVTATGQGTNMQAQHIATVLDPVTGIALSMHTEGDIITVNAATAGNQHAGGIAGLLGDRFVAVFEDNNPTYTDGADLIARVIDTRDQVNPVPIVGDLIQNGGRIQARRDVLVGTNGNDNIRGDILDNDGLVDWIFAGMGDDIVQGGPGVKGAAGIPEIIDGGEGVDIAVYTGRLQDYSITMNGDGSYEVIDLRPTQGANNVLLNNDGIDNLYNFEKIRFLDLSNDGASAQTIEFGFPGQAPALDPNYNGTPVAWSLDDTSVYKEITVDTDPTPADLADRPDGINVTNLQDGAGLVWTKNGNQVWAIAYDTTGKPDPVLLGANTQLTSGAFSTNVARDIDVAMTGGLGMTAVWESAVAAPPSVIATATATRNARLATYNTAVTASDNADAAAAAAQATADLTNAVALQQQANQAVLDDQAAAAAQTAAAAAVAADTAAANAQAAADAAVAADTAAANAQAAAASAVAADTAAANAAAAAAAAVAADAAAANAQAAADAADAADTAAATAQAAAAAAAAADAAAATAQAAAAAAVAADQAAVTAQNAADAALADDQAAAAAQAAADAALGNDQAAAAAQAAADAAVADDQAAAAAQAVATAAAAADAATATAQAAANAAAAADQAAATAQAAAASALADDQAAAAAQAAADAALAGNQAAVAAQAAANAALADDQAAAAAQATATAAAAADSAAAAAQTAATAAVAADTTAAAALSAAASAAADDLAASNAQAAATSAAADDLAASNAQAAATSAAADDLAASNAQAAATSAAADDLAASNAQAAATSAAADDLAASNAQAAATSAAADDLAASNAQAAATSAAADDLTASNAQAAATSAAADDLAASNAQAAAASAAADDLTASNAQAAAASAAADDLTASNAQSSAASAAADDLAASNAQSAATSAAADDQAAADAQAIADQAVLNGDPNAGDLQAAATALQVIADATDATALAADAAAAQLVADATDATALAADAAAAQLIADATDATALAADAAAAQLVADATDATALAATAAAAQLVADATDATALAATAAAAQLVANATDATALTATAAAAQLIADATDATALAATAAAAQLVADATDATALAADAAAAQLVADATDATALAATAAAAQLVADATDATALAATAAAAQLVADATDATALAADAAAAQLVADATDATALAADAVAAQATADATDAGALQATADALAATAALTDAGALQTAADGLAAIAALTDAAALQVIADAAAAAAGGDVAALQALANTLAATAALTDAGALATAAAAAQAAADATDAGALQATADAAAATAALTDAGALQTTADALAAIAALTDAAALQTIADAAAAAAGGDATALQAIANALAATAALTDAGALQTAADAAAATAALTDAAALQATATALQTTADATDAAALQATANALQATADLTNAPALQGTAAAAQATADATDATALQAAAAALQAIADATNATALQATASALQATADLTNATALQATANAAQATADLTNAPALQAAAAAAQATADATDAAALQAAANQAVAADNAAAAAQAQAATAAATEATALTALIAAETALHIASNGDSAIHLAFASTNTHVVLDTAGGVPGPGLPGGEIVVVGTDGAGIAVDPIIQGYEIVNIDNDTLEVGFHVGFVMQDDGVLDTLGGDNYGALMLARYEIPVYDILVDAGGNPILDANGQGQLARDAFGNPIPSTATTFGVGSETAPISLGLDGLRGTADDSQRIAITDQGLFAANAIPVGAHVLQGREMTMGSLHDGQLVVSYIGTDEKVHLKVYLPTVDEVSDRELRGTGADVVATGVTKYSEFTVPFPTTFGTIAPGSTAMTVAQQNGSFGVFWGETNATGGLAIKGIIYSGAGSNWSPSTVKVFAGNLPALASFQVASTGVTPGGLEDGFFVSWESAGQGVRGQRYNMDGQPVGNAIVVGDPTSGTPVLHATTGIDDGRMLVGYVDGTGVSAQFLDNRQPGIALIGPRTGAPADVIVGTVGDDAIDGRARNDQLFGGLGNDFITLGSGADQGFGGDGNDTILGGTGQDQLFGEAGDDLLWGGLSGPIEAQVDGDLRTGLVAAGVSAALIATDTGADIISGGAGIDTISYQGEFGDFNVDLASGIVTSDRDLNGTFVLEDVIGAIVDDGAGGTIFQFLHDIENATGGIGNDTLAGDAGANVLMGLGGNDILIGRGGNDILDGGDGIDRAVFSGLVSAYSFLVSGGVVTVHANTGTDGTDTVRNVEFFRFSNGAGGTVEFTLAQITALSAPIQVAATGTPVISSATPLQGQLLSVNTSAIVDPNGIGPLSFQWQRSGDGITWTSIGGATGATFAALDAPGTGVGLFAGQQLRVVVSFVDGLGNAEARTSAATGPVGYNYDASANAVAVSFTGLAGNDVLVGSAFADTLNGAAGNDAITGGAGNDTLNGQVGNDVITGGAGNDTINGGVGVDTVVFAGPVTDYIITGAASANTATLSVSATVGNEGTDTITNTEIFRFAGVDYTFIRGATTADAALNGGDGSEIIFGFGGADTINGGGGSDILIGGNGNDTVNGGAGDDYIFHRSAEGRDIIDGGAGTDTFILTGDASAETFRIYTAAAATAAGITGLAAGTEIVITRNGTNNASIIAQLDNIEEIKINTLLTTANNGNGVVDSSVQNGAVQGDTITVIGDFTQTSLAYSTIRVEGGAGNDTIDISGLTSAHRILLETNGGADTFVGDARPQDEINGIPRVSASDLHVGGSVEGDLDLMQLATQADVHTGGAATEAMHADFSMSSSFAIMGTPLGMHNALAGMFDDHQLAADYALLRA